MKNAPAKIFLADDHQILIDGLKSFFEEIPEYEIAGTANDGITLLQAIASHQPDLVLLDLNMPRMDGLQTLVELKKRYPALPVIILSNYHQTQLIKDVKSKGAAGYILKNGSMTELLRALDQVLQGGTYFQLGEEEGNPPQNQFFQDEFMQKFQLTRREIDIIRLVCQELNSREIGEKLFISEFTVTTHRRNILQKLNLKNTAGMMNFAKENGLL